MTSSTTASESNISDVANSVTNENKANTFKPFMIQANTKDSDILATPVELTRTLYLHNTSDPSYTNEQWIVLSDSDKFASLTKMKLPPVYNITSPFSTFVITPDTDDTTLSTIPAKDCKLLLTQYATAQGYSNFVSRLDEMDESKMREELIQAKQKLIARPQNQNSDNMKKIKTFSIPFILTHATTDNDILQAEEESLRSELRGIYTDHNLLDSLEWDELKLEDLRDLARGEREEMLKCFKPTPTKIKQEIKSAPTNDAKANTSASKEIIHIEDDSDSDDEFSTDEDGDAILEDATNEAVNSSDEFVREQLKNKISTGKTFRFKFTNETSDKEIFHLSYRRAIRIATVHSHNIDEPLSEAFIQNATTDEVYQYLIHERNEFNFQNEYDNFNLNSRTTDESIKSLQRLQLENFILFRYRDTDRQVTDDFFDNKTDIELKCFLISERDMLRTIDTTFNKTQHNPKDPVKPNDLPKGLHGKRQNLNG